ncbi:U32 family peptidase [Candidatus Woesearchaeota archaeon]|nr:U32 family peptidase [Candidatus Woesearchaeota archaeon]
MANKNHAEIMSPAGSFECLAAAIKAGADSVYFGVEHLNMRARAANNFKLSNLPKISKICKENDVKSYLTVNTILYDHDLSLMKKLIDAAKAAGVTAIIASDIAAISYAHSVGIEVHISTQLNVSNIEAVKFYSQYADVVVLARELSIQQIKKICDDIKTKNICGPAGELVKIELFAHGALCVSISGKCYMSLATYNASANRGLCLQNCRRAYKVTDEETGVELVVDNKYIMSPKDLCTIGFIDKILEAGVSVLKIEGRGKKADYVYTVTKVYREAADCYLNGKSDGKYISYTKEKIDAWTKRLEEVYNRGFWHGGYYLGKKLGEWSNAAGSKATKEKIYVGKAKNYFSKSKVGEFIIEADKIKVGDEVIITGPTTGFVEGKVSSISSGDKAVNIAGKGADITIPIKEKIRKNDKLFVVVERSA